MKNIVYHGYTEGSIWGKVLHTTHFILPALLLIFCSSCHKTCYCTGFNGMEHAYTEEEVDAHGGGCSNMIMQADTRYYSVCVWR